MPGKSGLPLGVDQMLDRSLCPMVDDVRKQGDHGIPLSQNSVKVSFKYAVTLA
jgi:hypothetical protein